MNATPRAGSVASIPLAPRRGERAGVRGLPFDSIRCTHQKPLTLTLSSQAGRGDRKTILAILVSLLALAADDPRPVAPVAVAVDGEGDLLIADPRLPGVWRRDAQGRLHILQRGTPRDRAPLQAIRALAVGHGGEVFAADSATGEVYQLRPDRPPEPLTGGALEIPTGLAVLANGDLIVADLRLGQVVRVRKKEGKVEEVARVAAPRGLAVGRSGVVAVLLADGPALARLAPDGTTTMIAAGEPFRFPLAVVADPESDGWLVADGGAAAVWSVAASGVIRARVRGAPLVHPSGLAFGPDGTLFIADPRAGQVFRVGPDGAIKPILGGKEPMK